MGFVQVTLGARRHRSYVFAFHTAWDDVPWSDTLRELAQRTDTVCLGTLGQRDGS